MEYIDNEMIVTDTPVVTNFYLAAGEKYGIGSEQSHNRYETLSALLSANSSVMNGQQVCEALAAVAQSNFADSDEGTQWSLVYDTDSLKVQFYRKERYDEPYTMTLQGEYGWLENRGKLKIMKLVITDIENLSLPLDRFIFYIHPDFVKRKGEMHHKRRYSNVLAVSAFFMVKISAKKKKKRRKR